MNKWRFQKPSPVETVTMAVILAAAIVYFIVLHILDGRAETYFTDLKKTNPSLYLTQLRESRGFDAYLTQYSAFEGYDQYMAAAPSFLVGRWTMRPAPIRLTPGSAPAACSDPITFDYGILLMLEAGGGTARVDYKIAGGEVLIKEPTVGIIPVKLISYGAELDHIEFTPPGMQNTVYAYHCGR